MKQIKISNSILVSTILLSFSTSAAISGNIGATSNFLWRGVTQTQNAVAIQGGLDYEHNSGLYLGTWASNVDFGDDTSYELDFYTGYTGTIGNDFGYDINYIYYAYPDSDSDVDFGELSAGISWKWFSLGYSHVVNASNDVASDPLDNTDMGYINAGVSFPLSDTLSISAHFGYSSGDIVTSWFDTSNYTDYSVSINKKTDLGSISFSLSDTDLDDNDPKIALGYSYSFDI